MLQRASEWPVTTLSDVQPERDSSSHHGLGLTHTRLRINPLAGSAAILCIGGLDVVRKEGWPFYRTISGVRLYWVLEEPKGPKGQPPPGTTYAEKLWEEGPSAGAADRAAGSSRRRASRPLLSDQ